MLDIKKIRQDFPLLQKKIHGKPIIYLDSTATSLKPRSVIGAINRYYSDYSANVFRGIYKISEEATFEYEKARESIAELIHAAGKEEVIFTRNASESLNLIAASWAGSFLHSGDEILTTIVEHHSNFVPWQQLSIQKGCKLKIWNPQKDGDFDIRELDKLVTRKTKLVALTAASNVTGIILDIKAITKKVKTLNPDCIVLVDGAQAVPHMPVDVRDWGIDFLAFSGHKMLGPTGIGALWGKRKLLESMPPYQYGGDMIREVHTDRTVFNDLPHKFEAGTPHIAGAIGFGAAASYLQNIGMKNVRAHEKELVRYALTKFHEVKDVTVYGPQNPEIRGGVISFTLKGIHPHDVAQILDEDNICIRVGFHCAQPLHEYLGCGPTARASFYIYTSKADIDALVEGLEKVKKIFK